MKRRDVTIICALMLGAIVVICGVYIYSNGTSHEHHTMADYSPITGYEGLYVLNSDGIHPTDEDSVGQNSFIVMGGSWISSKGSSVTNVMEGWLSQSSVLITLNSGSSIFDPLREDSAIGFDPSAQIHALYRNGTTSYCLSLTSDGEWEKIVMDGSWRSNDKAEIVNKDSPCCISTTVYRQADGMGFTDTDIYWTVHGQYLPVTIWIDGVAVQITPEHGFYTVNVFDFKSAGYSMRDMLFKTVTDGKVKWQAGANIHFDENNYSLSMPVAMKGLYWSLPSERTGPYSSYVDIGGSYGDYYEVSTKYGFKVGSGTSGNFRISSGGSFQLLNDTYGTYDGSSMTDMSYEKGLNRYSFSIRSDFSLPTEIQKD